MNKNNNTKSSVPKMNLTEKPSSNSFGKRKISAHTIIMIIGIVFSSILFFAKISWINRNWKTPLIPLMIAIQIIFISAALKNRYKK
jgi:hypothetical protein